MTLLSAENLTVRYGGFTALSGVSFSLEAGEWMMLIGPNGSGKTTLAKAVTGALPYEGTIRIAGRDLSTFSAKELASRIGILSQHHELTYAFRAEEVVRLGRYAHRSLFGAGDPDGRRKIEEAMEICGVRQFADKTLLSLSGGELQRVFLAQLFAQDPSILLLDEPTNHLDPLYQKQIFDLIREWVSCGSRAVLSIVHDLSIARAYGTCGLLISAGRTVAKGGPEDVFASAPLADSYGMDVAGWFRSLADVWM